MRFALLGHPVGHSMSPVIQGAAFAALGLPHQYELIDAASEADLERAVSMIRRGELGGANVTVPYKRAVLGLVDEAAPSVMTVGAANVIVRGEGGRLIAHNTDADALAADIEASLGDRIRGRAAIFGAGGAGLAAVAAAKKLGFGEVCVTTRSWGDVDSIKRSSYLRPMVDAGATLGVLSLTAERIEGLGAAAIVDWIEWLSESDLIVQATSAGMKGVEGDSAVAEVLPYSRIKPGALLYDVVYNPVETDFVRGARERGLMAIGGMGMLVRQAAMSFTLWTGLPAPLDVMCVSVGLTGNPIV